MEAWFAADADMISLRNWDEEQVLSVGHGPMVQGYLPLIKAMSKDIDIRLNHRVIKITNGYKKAMVTIENGMVFVTDATTVTVPLGFLKANLIDFELSLLEWKLAAISDLGVGKCFLTQENLLSISYQGGEQIEMLLDVILMIWLEIHLIYMTNSEHLLEIFSSEVRLLAWNIRDLHMVLTLLESWLQKIVKSILWRDLEAGKEFSLSLAGRKFLKRQCLSRYQECDFSELLVSVLFSRKIIRNYFHLFKSNS